MIDRPAKKKRAPAAAKVHKQPRGSERTWLVTGAVSRKTHFLLAHGAGAGMTSPFLTRIAHLIDEGGVTVHRFEFPYMAARSADGGRRPAPRAETLVEDYLAAIAECRQRIGPAARLFIGGKSMGGRIACLAATASADNRIKGVAVLGFPLIPPNKPASSRARVIEDLDCPALIVQGTRDAFGGPEAFAKIRLPAGVRLHRIPDGDHDLKPRKASGLTHDEALRDTVDAMTSFFTESLR